MRDENEVTVKDMAIGAVALFICYKLLKLIFGNSNEKKIDPMYVMSTRPSAVYVANTIEECQYAVTVLKSHLAKFGSRVLGFDAEWVCNYYTGRRPVALLQLATQHFGPCFLFRLQIMKEIPRELREILEDKEIIKVGVDVKSDATYLYKDHGIQVNGVFDLRYMAVMCGLRQAGLAQMSRMYLSIDLDKKMQISNWEQSILSYEQIFYAAMDAIISVELYTYFLDCKKENDQKFKKHFNKVLSISDFLDMYYIPRTGELIYENCNFYRIEFEKFVLEESQWSD